jgi:fibronectin type 3 domain-containing protein
MKRTKLIMAGAWAVLLMSVFFLTGCGNRKLADLTAPELEDYYSKKNNPFPKPYPKPTTPTGVSATALTSTSIQIAWNAVPAAVTYKIYVPVDQSSSEDFVLKTTVTTNSYIDNTVKASQTCLYKVSADNRAGESGLSASVSAKTPDPLGRPESVAAAHVDYPLRPNSSRTSIRIAWEAVSDAVGYNVYEAVGGTWQKVGSTTRTWWEHTGLSPSTSHRYMVKAVDSGGTEGAASVDNSMSVGRTAS